MGIIKDWHKSRSQSVRLGQRQTQQQQEQASDEESHPWLKFWRKIKRERRKNKKQSNSNSPVSLQQPTYDPDTYLQNFDDEGSRWTEPDFLYRSFSARFADPSRAFCRNAMVG
ncbi:unnamed protein product [Camellia sinensis]